MIYSTNGTLGPSTSEQAMKRVKELVSTESKASC